MTMHARLMSMSLILVGALIACNKGSPGAPAEAIEACKSNAEGAACSVQMGDKKTVGTCRKGPDGTLACMPEGGPPGSGGPPPGGPPPAKPQ